MMSVLPADLKSVRLQYPTLCRAGFVPIDDLRDDDFDPASVRFCATFFTHFCHPTKTLQQMGSYGWKHVLEKLAQPIPYIANGDCIAGAALAGVRIVPEGINARFAVRVSKGLARDWYQSKSHGGDWQRSDDLRRQVSARVYEIIDRELVS